MQTLTSLIGAFPPDDNAVFGAGLCYVDLATPPTGIGGLGDRLPHDSTHRKRLSEELARWGSVTTV